MLAIAAIESLIPYLLSFRISPPIAFITIFPFDLASRFGAGRWIPLASLLAYGPEATAMVTVDW